MNITGELREKVASLAKAYDAAPVDKRAAAWGEFENAVSGLSDKQCMQLARMIQHDM